MRQSRVFVFVFVFAVTAGLQGASGSTNSPTETPASRKAVKPPSPLLRNLSLHDRVAQLFVVRGYGDYPPSSNAELRTFTKWIRDDHVGGFIVAGRIRNGHVISAQPFEMAAFINHMQRLARTPLLVASDFEHGASSRVASTAIFPALMAFGAAHDPSAIRDLGAATAHDARALGVNWIFAPDADVNNNPDNPIINVRSFGENPEAVALGVSAFIEGAHSDPAEYVLVAAKHFPGHGDTAEDSHLQLAKLEQPRERIESVELVPFRGAIAHGVDSIMTAHMAVPAFEPQLLPATLSPNVLTGLLRKELGFDGLIVTDALEMHGIASMFSQGEASIRALEAGADVLLMPTDPEICIQAILGAIRSGRLSRQRIDRSASRIMAAKQRAGLFRRRLVDLDKLSDTIEDVNPAGLAQRVADEAVTLVKDEKHLFPMPGGGSCLIVLAENPYSQRGEVLKIELARTIHDLKTYIVHPGMPETLLAAVASDVAQCHQVYIASFLSSPEYGGTAPHEGPISSSLNSLIQSSAPVALISLGNPYLIRDFPSVSAYAATFSSGATSEIAAAKAILGEIPITGKLPISIPGLAKLGEGIDVPAKAKSASNSPE